MSDITETRWKRYGKDRVYVKTTNGVDIGHIDLLTGTITTTCADHEYVMLECASRWLSAEPTETSPTPDASRRRTEPAPQSVELPELRERRQEPRQEWLDLSGNEAGAAARAKREEVNSQAPVINFIGRVLGVKTEERSWRVGAKGEKKVAAVLDQLSADWRVIHAVEVGERGADIDHVVIGPAGVFTLNTKRHPGAKAWIGEQAVLVNGHKTDYLRNSRHEGQRAAKLLAAALGRSIPVRPGIVFVDLAEFTVKQQPRDVIVTTRMRVVDLLRGLPTTLSTGEVEAIHAISCRSTTWQPSSPTGSR